MNELNKLYNLNSFFFDLSHSLSYFFETYYLLFKTLKLNNKEQDIDLLLKYYDIYQINK